MSSDLEFRLKEVKRASFQMASLKAEEKNAILEDLANELETSQESLFSANQRDLKEQEKKISQSLYQRLKFDSNKVADLISGLRDLKRLEDPTGVTLWCRELDEGLILEKKSVPLGVFAVIFESRPDVFPQVAALALKSGNALILKGGKEAHHTNHAMFELTRRVSGNHKRLPKNWIMLVDSREEIRKVLSFPQYIDLVIPRGSNELVQSVQRESLVPVLGHADGVCHIYLHEGADLKKAWDLILDAKTQYPSACNSVETLLVDQSWGDTFLKEFHSRCKERGVKILGCPWTRKTLSEVDEVASWHREYGDLTLAVKGVSGLDDAVEHINEFGSHHTDMIISEDAKVVEEFLERVDSASVFANASTRFADGFRFGMGAEIGISTSKTHARGPVGLEGLVSYKYLLRGKGQIVAGYVGTGARRFTHKPCL